MVDQMNSKNRLFQETPVAELKIRAQDFALRTLAPERDHLDSSHHSRLNLE